MFVAVDLSAQAVLLMIDLNALASGQMTVIQNAIGVNFLSHSGFLTLQVGALAGVQSAIGDAVADAALLVFKALIDLRKAGSRQCAGKN